ncbi:MAG: TonB-dependent receptor, partial [Kordiimonadaceae bacterium]|nr:TonB-dependent receptor [Kordiimonadaceae bacterium]
MSIFTRQTKRSMFRTLLLTTAALSMVPAVQAADDSFELEEIIVTALKRSTGLQDTPISIAAISGDKLAKMGADDMADYIITVPSLSLVDGGPGQRRLVIRGVQGTGEAQVGLYYDETPVTGAPGAGNSPGSSLPDLKLFDVERVEVLRGPQGTLYGAGSMSGTVRVIMNKPNTEEYEGAFDGTISGTRYGGTSYQLNAMVNVPLVEDKVAARAVIYWRDTAGYIDNTRLGIADHNSEDSWGGRFSLRFKATDNLTIDASAIIQRTNVNGDFKWTAGVNDFETTEYTRTPYFDDTDILNLTLNWDLDFATLTTSSSYYERRAEVNFDTTGFIATFENGPFCAILAGQNPGTDPCTAEQQTAHAGYIDSLLPATVNQPQNIDNWTHEIRLSSQGDGPFHWGLGVFSESRDADLKSQVISASENGEERIPFEFIFHRQAFEKLTQKAVFGEVSYDVTEKLTLTTGARYFDYDKTVTGVTIVGFALVNASPSDIASVDSGETGWQFKFHAGYQATDDMLFYAQAAEGFRVGGANQVIGLPDGLTPYTSDSLWNYEVGAKTQWDDGRYTLNAAAYYIDWSNIQVSGRTPDGAFGFTSNAGAATIKGFEVEFVAYPTDGLELSGGFNVNDAKLSEDQVNEFVVSEGQKGDRIPRVANFSGSLAAQYSWEASSEFNGMVRGDLSYVGGSFSEFSTRNEFYEDQGDYTILNIRGGI